MSLQIAAIALLCLMSIANAQFDGSACGHAKGCLFAPPGCAPGQNCQVSFSYVADGDYLEMELYGASNGNSYISAAFSADQMMGQDTVVYCATSGGQPTAGLAVNGVHSNAVLHVNGVQQILQSTFNNGNVYCKIRQLINPKNSQLLTMNRPYFILVATGMFQNGELVYHMQDRWAMPMIDPTSYHRQPNGQVTILPPNMNLVKQRDPSGGRTTAEKLYIAHGILMVLSWSIFLATGILFARYYRDHFPNTIFLGVRMWFNLHRTLNMIGIGGTICGFVMIFVALDWQWAGPRANQPKQLNQQWTSVHAILGLLACVVAWAQPLNAVFRCGPDDKGRWLYNWIHRFFGCGAFLMAAAATMIAVVHFGTLFSNRDAALGLYICYIAVLGCVIIVLELLKIRSWWMDRRRVGTELDPTRSYQLEEDAVKIRRVQAVIMIFFLVVAIGTAVAISILIGLH